jgi:hypothetical protein
MSRCRSWSSSVLVTLLWSAAVLAGTWALAVYEATPGSLGNTPRQAPRPGGLEGGIGKPSFILFIHPHCPCSAASLSEWAQLLADAPGEVAAEVLFVRPEGVGE